MCDPGVPSNRPDLDNYNRTNSAMAKLLGLWDTYVNEWVWPCSNKTLFSQTAVPVVELFNCLLLYLETVKCCLDN